MDRSLTMEQKNIIRAARGFAEKLFPDIAQECDREADIRIGIRCHGESW